MNTNYIEISVHSTFCLAAGNGVAAQIAYSVSVEGNPQHPIFYSNSSDFLSTSFLQVGCCAVYCLVASPVCYTCCNQNTLIDIRFQATDCSQSCKAVLKHSLLLTYQLRMLNAGIHNLLPAS